MFYLATADQIKSGEVTDIYFRRTEAILKARGVHRRVLMEVRAGGFPRNWPWAVLAGVEEAAELLQGLPVSVWALSEGTLIQPDTVVLAVEGDYLDFGVHETALLGFLCHSSGVATMAARCKKAAGHRTVLSFGARRSHPAIGPMMDRSAFLGGCDGVSAVLSAELIGEEPIGTMPHALILLLGDTVEAVKAFHEIIDQKVGRVALVDTFLDERFEAVRVAETLGKALFAVRLDTPASRRGDFLELFREIRWELDLRGFGHVKLIASGGLDEFKIRELNPVVDGYGVGTSISNAPVVDFALDIVEVEGQPLSKRGKRSGRKRLLRCRACFAYQEIPARADFPCCACGGQFEDLLQPLIQEGKVLRSLPRPREIRNDVLKQLERVEL